ncbi:ABC transporter permease [Vallitaleaceae bacterium 9-2]
MHLTENFKQAFLSLSTNKLRSILTMLGIIMGVFSVVAILAISNAAKVFMLDEFNKMGANSIIIQNMSSNGEELEERDRLTMDDLYKIKEGVAEVEFVTAAQVFYSDIRVEDGYQSAYVTGATHEYPNFQAMEFVHGRFLSAEDIEGQRRVIVVPDTYAKEHFGRTDIIGEEVTITNYYGELLKLRVIGVLSTEDNLFSSMMEGMPVEVVVPVSLTQAFFDSDTVDQIQVSVFQGTNLKEAGEKIVRLLEFVNQNEDKYMATSIEDIQKSVGSVLDVISMIFVVIAVITLVVGGIGIINILLVSVTERIREIGLRKAIGAKKRDIIMQFLTESIMMTGFSGLIGIILGLITGGIISALIKIPPVVDLKTVIFTFTGSIVLGIVFGVYPAKKAADLDPIESLRYE